jgi:regulator of sirC expression with transglutaminase-like and TPR domain
MDVAEANLRLADGLPGTEGLCVDDLLARLNDWTEFIRHGTNDYRELFERDPAQLKCSWPNFYMQVMLTFLGRDLRVRYNIELMRDPVDWSDARDAFIQGVLTGYGGTCASMPVLYTAVGRRLGYPMYIVECVGHRFARWDSGKGERINLGSTNDDVVIRDDEYYRHWPCKLTPAELASGIYMQNLTPREEIAKFLIARNLCLLDNEQWDEALRSAYYARWICPEHPHTQGHYLVTLATHHIMTGEFTYELDDRGELVALVKDWYRGTPYPGERWAARSARTEIRRRQEIARLRANGTFHSRPFSPLYLEAINRKRKHHV